MGYISTWYGFSDNDYKEASESVYDTNDIREDRMGEETKRGSFSLDQYEIVRSHFFSLKDKPVATIGNNRLTFNTVSLKKFEDVEYVELLLNTVEKCIAVRPCEPDSPNAIRWGRKKDGKWIPSQRTISGFAAALYTIAGWDKDNRYRLCGQYFSDGTDQMLVFDLSEPEIIQLVKKGEYQAVEDSDGEESVNTSEKTDAADESEIVTVYSLETVYPESWKGHFGDVFCNAGFERIPYSGNWEILRPARTYAAAGGIRQEIISEIEAEAQKMLQGLGLAI